MAISVRFSEKDEALIKAYANFNNISLSDFIRNAVLEKIEDEYDLAVAQEAYEEYVKSGEKSTPISELWKELDL